MFISYSKNRYSISASGLRGLNHMSGFDYTVYAVGDRGKIYFRRKLYSFINKKGIEISDKYKELDFTN